MFLNLQKTKTNQLRRYREKRSLRQRDIAELLGMADGTGNYCRWETGRKQPTLLNALRLSAVLNCPIEILYIDHFNQIRKEIHQAKSKISNNNN